MNEIDTLAARQEKILIQLEQFKKQLQDIRSGLNLCAKPGQQQSKSAEKTRNSGVKTQVGLKSIDVSV